MGPSLFTMFFAICTTDTFTPPAASPASCARTWQRIGLRLTQRTVHAPRHTLITSCSRAAPAVARAVTGGCVIAPTLRRSKGCTNIQPDSAALAPVAKFTHAGRDTFLLSVMVAARPGHGQHHAMHNSSAQHIIPELPNSEGTWVSTTSTTTTPRRGRLHVVETRSHSPAVPPPVLSMLACY